MKVHMHPLADPGSEFGDHMVRTYNGGLVAEPQGGPGTIVPGQRAKQTNKQTNKQVFRIWTPFCIITTWEVGQIVLNLFLQKQKKSSGVWGHGPTGPLGSSSACTPIFESITGILPSLIVSSFCVTWSVTDWLTAIHYTLIFSRESRLLHYKSNATGNYSV